MIEVPRGIFLVGFMGSGKSSVGRIVAARLGRPFEDTDEIVERTEGRSIETIFRESGEGRFREAEWRALQGIGASSAVVATGGGLFLGVPQRRFMKERGISVWLDAPLETIRRRVGRGEGRAMWDGQDPVGLRALFERRRAAYALADLRVDASGDDPARVADRVLARIETVSH